MKAKIAVYNLEWTRDLLEEDRSLKTTGKDGKRSQQLAEIVHAMHPDFLGIAEGSNTLVNGSKIASIQLEKWVQHFLPCSPLKGIHGFPSSGQQELCALYNPNKFKVLFTPETKPGQRFDELFLTDTTNRLIKEQYEHYRPPLELSILGLDCQLFSRVIIAHTKSKGIFDMVDYARFEQISQRDRLKLFAECLSIRERCDDYLEKGQQVIMMGDINDGSDLDFYENKFNKSAVEILLGDLCKPKFVLKSTLPKPKLNSYGWTPYSSRVQGSNHGRSIKRAVRSYFGQSGLEGNSGKSLESKFGKRRYSDPIYQNPAHTRV